MPQPIKRSEVVENDIFKALIAEMERGKVVNDELNKSLKETATLVKSGITGMAKPKDLTALQEANLKLKEANQLFQQKLRLVEQEKKDAILVEKLKREEIRTQEMINKGAEREIRNKERLSGAYGRINKALGSLRAEYRDLAVKQSLNAKLTDAEIKRMETLSGRINQFDGALKKVDASMGLHQRNVGNYTGQWNGLGNSINQLTREAPAFANSMQTGFMAISNNIPTLVDEINRLKVANQQLAAEGKPTESVLKKIAGALFSWQTAISLGVTLLTVYGAKLVDWVISLRGVNKELENQKKIREITKKTQEDQVKFIAKESNEFSVLIARLKSTNKGSEERKQLIDILNDQYGATLKNLQNEALFQRQVNQELSKYLLFKELQFKINKNEEYINEVQEKQLRIKKQINEENKKLISSRQLLATLESGLKQGETDPTGTLGNIKNSIELQENLIASLRNELSKADQDYLKFGTRIQELIGKMDTLGYNLDEGTSKTDKNGKTVKEIVKHYKDWSTYIEKVNQSLGENISAVEVSNERLQNTAQIAVLEAEIQLELAKQRGDKDAILNAEEELKKAKIAQIELEAKLEKESAGNDEVLKQKIERQKELDILQLEEIKKVEEQKKTYSDISKIIKATSDIFIQQSNRRLEAIDKEINKRQEQYNLYVELSKNGTIQAQQSLALEQKAIAEANRKKAEEQRRQERIKFAESAFSAYSANVEKGEKNPLLKTITDMTLLRQFILSLPTFEKGIEDTGANGKGVDGRGGFLSVLHPNERVLTKGQNSMIGDMTNDQVAETINKVRTGQLVNMGEGATQIGGNWNLNPLLTKIDDLTNIIKNKPEHSVQAGEIIQGAMQIIETKKEGRTIKRNRYIIR